MRYDKLTTKFQAALQEAQSQAMASDCGYLEAVHVLQALLNDNDSGAAALLVQAGGNITQIKQGVQAALNALPKVSGQGGEMFPSRELQNALNLMDKAAVKRGDAYIASELFLLGLIQENGATGKILKDAGVTEAKLNQAIEKLNQGQTVDNPNAEDQREALKKYTTDLTERARNGKLDPVIGRDDEIRRAIQVLQKQPRAHRRAGRGQNRDCGRLGAAHRKRRSARKPARQTPAGAGFGGVDCGREIPRRI